MQDIDKWRHHQSQKESRELVSKTELNLLIEMLKREIEVAMRTHFDIFKNEALSGIDKKVDKSELKTLLQGKVSISEFWKEIDHIKSMMHTMSRELAGAGIGGASGNKGGNSVIRTMIKQECEGKIDKVLVDQMLVEKADLKAFHELIKR